MNRIMKAIITITLVMLVGTLLGISDDAGTTGFNSLKIVYSARANSMGGAFTSLDDDIDAVFYNPANLARYKNKREVSTTFMNYFDGYNGGSLVYQFARSKKANVAFFTQYLASDEITKTVESASGGYYEDGTFTSSDLTIGANYSYYFNEAINLGVNAKYIMESIDGNDASAIAFDLGLLHRPANERMRVGASIKNLGSQLTYFSDDEYKENLPMTYSGGISYRFDLSKKINKDGFKPTMLLALDVNMPKGSDFYGVLGADIHVHKMFFVRLGYKSNSDDWKTGGDYEAMSGLSTGVGFVRNNIKIDYAINSYGDLGFVNQVTVKYQF